MYGGYFWRLKGSNKTPNDYVIQQQQKQMKKQQQQQQAQKKQQQQQKEQQSEEPTSPPPSSSFSPSQAPTTLTTKRSNRVSKKTEALLMKEDDERQRQERIAKKRRREEQKRVMLLEKKAAEAAEWSSKVVSTSQQPESDGIDGPDFSKKRKIDVLENENTNPQQQQQQQQKGDGDEGDNNKIATSSNPNKRFRRSGPLILKGIELKIENIPSDAVPMYSNKSSSATYKGVHKLADRTNNPWTANISFHAEKLFIGSFETEIKAARMYAWAHLLLYGEEKTQQVAKSGEDYRKKKGLPLLPFISHPLSSSSSLGEKNTPVTPSPRDSSSDHIPRKQVGEHIVVDGIELDPGKIPDHITPIYACQGSNSNTYRGIYMHKHSWMAGIRSKGRKIHLGSYETEQTAARIYAWAHFIIHGKVKTKQAIQKGEEYRLTNGLQLISSSASKPDRTSPAPKSTTSTRTLTIAVPVVKGIELKPANMPMDVVPIYACRKGDPNTYRGVSFRHNSWKAGIWLNGGRLHLGSYEKDVQAACIYAWAHLILHGKQKTDEVTKAGEEYQRREGLPLIRFPRPHQTAATTEKGTKLSPSVPPTSRASKTMFLSSSKRASKRAPTKNGPIIVRGVELKLENLPSHIIPMYNNSGRGNTVYKGTYYHHSNSGWVASLWLGRGTPQLYLGSYSTERAAACIYAWAYTILYGEEKAADVRIVGENYRMKRGLPLFEAPSVRTTSSGEVVIENVHVRLINNGAISTLDDSYPTSRSKDALISSRKDEKLHRVFFENDDLKLITKFPSDAMTDFKAGKKTLRFIVGNNVATWDHNKLKKHTFQDLIKVAGWKRGLTIECQISMVDVHEEDDSLKEFWI